jgi:hypothetical protein
MNIHTLARISPLRADANCFCGSRKKYRACCSKLSSLPKGSSEEQVLRYWQKRIFEETVRAQRLQVQLIEEVALFEKKNQDLLCGSLSESPAVAYLEDLLSFWGTFYFRLQHQHSEDCGCNHEHHHEGPSDDTEDDSITFAEIYLESSALQREEDRRRVIESMIRTPFSFFVTVRVGRSKVVVRDLVTRHEREVSDKRLGLSLSEGQIVFAQVVELGGLFLISKIGAVLLPSDYLSAIEDFLKDVLTLSSKESKENYQNMLLKRYIEYVDEVISSAVVIEERRSSIVGSS